jgi:hypothetical protein
MLALSTVVKHITSPFAEISNIITVFEFLVSKTVYPVVWYKGNLTREVPLLKM